MTIIETGLLTLNSRRVYIGARAFLRCLSYCMVQRKAFEKLFGIFSYTVTMPCQLSRLYNSTKKYIICEKKSDSAYQMNRGPRSKR